MYHGSLTGKMSSASLSSYVFMSSGSTQDVTATRRASVRQRHISPHLHVRSGHTPSTVMSQSVHSK